MRIKVSRDYDMPFQMFQALVLPYALLLWYNFMAILSSKWPWFIALISFTIKQEVLINRNLEKFANNFPYFNY